MSKHSTLKVSEHHLMSSLIKLFDCHLSRLIEGSELKGQSEHELNPLFEGKHIFDEHFISYTYIEVIKEYGQMIHLLTFRDVLLFLHLVHWSCLWQRDQEEIQHDLQPVAERRSFGGCQKIPSARSLRCTTSRHTLCFPPSKGRRCVFMQGMLVKYQNIAIKDRLKIKFI